MNSAIYSIAIISLSLSLSLSPHFLSQDILLPILQATGIISQEWDVRLPANQAFLCQLRIRCKNIGLKKENY